MYRRAPRTLTSQFLGGSGGRQIFQFIENRAQKFGEVSALAALVCEPRALPTSARGTLVPFGLPIFTPTACFACSATFCLAAIASSHNSSRNDK